MAVIASRGIWDIRVVVSNWPQKQQSGNNKTALFSGQIKTMLCLQYKALIWKREEKYLFGDWTRWHCSPNYSMIYLLILYLTFFPTLETVLKSVKILTLGIRMHYVPFDAKLWRQDPVPHLDLEEQLFIALICTTGLPHCFPLWNCCRHKICLRSVLQCSQHDKKYLI